MRPQRSNTPERRPGHPPLSPPFTRPTRPPRPRRAPREPRGGPRLRRPGRNSPPLSPPFTRAESQRSYAQSAANPGPPSIAAGIPAAPTRRAPRPRALPPEPQRLEHQVAHAAPVGRGELVHAPAGPLQQPLQVAALVILETVPGVAGVADDEAGAVVDPLPVDAACGSRGAFGESWHADRVGSAVAKLRLDALLAERGLFASRSRAAASVIAGEVRLGPAASARRKPGQLVADDVVVAVAERAAVRLARRASSSPTRSTRSGSTSPAGAASTSAPRPAASPTACCSAAPRRWSRSTSPTASCTGAAQRPAGDRDRARQRARARADELPVRARPRS